jgi:hypothetical protein
MSNQKFSEKFLEQREKVEKECRKLQTLIDKEMEDISFMWYSDSNNLSITEDIFRKTKRIRELNQENIIGNDCINIMFQVEGPESLQTSVPPNTVVLEVEGSQRPLSFLPFNSVVPGSQSSPEAEVLESTSDYSGVTNP